MGKKGVNQKQIQNVTCCFVCNFPRMKRELTWVRFIGSDSSSTSSSSPSSLFSFLLLFKIGCSSCIVYTHLCCYEQVIFTLVKILHDKHAFTIIIIWTGCSKQCTMPMNT